MRNYVLLFGLVLASCSPVTPILTTQTPVHATAISSPTATPDLSTPTPETPMFQSTELAEQLGYSVEELRSEDYIGVEKGDGQIGDLTYNGLLGIKKGGSKELIGLQFEDNFVRISAKDIIELSAKVPNDSPFFELSYTTNPYTEFISISVVSTGIVENIEVKNDDNEIVGYMQTYLAVTNDINGNPRLIRAPMQIETVENPEVDILNWMVPFYSDYTLTGGTVYSKQELEQIIGQGVIVKFGVPKKYVPSNAPGESFIIDYLYNDPLSNLVDNFLSSGGVTVLSQIPTFLFTGMLEEKT